MVLHEKEPCLAVLGTLTRKVRAEFLKTKYLNNYFNPAGITRKAVFEASIWNTEKGLVSMFFEQKFPAIPARRSADGPGYVRFFTLFIVLFLFISGLPGCIEWDSDDDDDRKELNVGVNALPETLDPAQAYDPVSLFVVGNVYETLVRYDEESVYDVVPGVASSWEIDNFYKTFTFYLKGNIMFSNGNSLTAEDVQYSLLRAIEMDQEPAWLLSQVIDTSNITIGNFNPQADSVEDVRITLKYPYRSFLKILAFPVASIVDKETVEGGSSLSTSTMGSGPYTVTSVGETSMALKRNGRYHMGWEKKFVEKVTLKVYQSEEEKLTALEKEKIDVATVSSVIYDGAGDLPTVTVTSVDSLKIGFIGFNTNAIPFNGTDIREAFSMMLDFAAMTNDVLTPFGTREAFIYPAEMDISSTHNPVQYSPLDALDIFEKYYTVEEGLVQDFPTISAKYPAGNFLLEGTLMLYQSNLALIGITLELEAMNSTEYLSALRGGQTEIFAMEWEPDYADPDAYAYPLLHSGSTDKGNFAFYSNASVDEKIEEAKDTLAPDTRKMEYAEIAGIAAGDHPYLWLYSAKGLFASQNYVFGITFNPVIQMDLYGVNLV